MKKIILVGKRCDETHDLFFNLNEHFEVKLCTTDYNVLQETIKVFEPDLIVICFAKYMKPDSRFFDFLKDKGRRTPVITAGLEVVDATYDKVNSNSNFENIKRWDANKLILQRCCNMLGLSMNSIDQLSEDEENQKPLILVVDDFAMLLRQIRMMLKDMYDVEVATSGVQAMTAIGRRKPDLILLDYAMPVHDGKKIFEVLKAKPETKDIPVVFLTGVSDYERVEEIINLHPAGYLLKPPVKERLVEMIENVLERRRKKIAAENAE